MFVGFVEHGRGLVWLTELDEAAAVAEESECCSGTTPNSSHRSVASA